MANLQNETATCAHPSTFDDINISSAYHLHKSTPMSNTIQATVGQPPNYTDSTSEMANLPNETSACAHPSTFDDINISSAYHLHKSTAMSNTIQTTVGQSPNYTDSTSDMANLQNETSTCAHPSVVDDINITSAYPLHKSTNMPNTIKTTAVQSPNGTDSTSAMANPQN